MKFLLDAHAYLWYRSSPGKLPAKVLALITETSNEALISVVTPWELAIKSGIGKLDARPLLVDFERRETAAGFAIVGITTMIAIRSGLFPLHHRDPFDRLLAAQSLELDVPLLSNDRVFDLYGANRLWI
jgi:PIN domain nuclease of toxin-antitoxin system